jgi:hypothetical protein
MATTLSTLAVYANGGTQCRRFLLQGAGTDTVAESVTIAHLLATWLVNATLASQILKVNLSKHLAATSVLAPWYVVSYSTTEVVLARAQVAASAANLEVELMAAHSVIL